MLDSMFLMGVRAERVRDVALLVTVVAWKRLNFLGVVDDATI